jgi:hypothetical protein
MESKVIKIILRTFEFFGLWSSSKRSLTIFVHLMLIHILSVFMLLNIKNNQSLIQWMEFVSSFSLHSSFVVKATNLYFRTNDIMDLVTMLTVQLKNYEITEKFSKRIKRTEFFFKFAWGLGAVTIFLTGVRMYFSKVLIHSMWVPFSDNQISFYIAAFYQHLTCIILLTLDMMADFLAIFFMMYIIAMLEQINDRLEVLKSVKHKNT